MTRGVKVVGMAFVLVAAVSAQAPVVISSVKPTTRLDEGVGGSGLEGDTYRITSAPLVYVLSEAFDLPLLRIVGGPDWIRRDRWDIEIRADRRDAAARLRAEDVIQAMLRDRFRLDAAIEKRDWPIYALRLASANRRLGPLLARSSFQCRRGNTVDRVDIAHQAQLRAEGVKGAHGEDPCSVTSQAGILSFGGRTLEDLLNHLPADRVIQDQTGLTESVDLTLRWNVTGDPAVDSAAMFAAMRSDLGLKLEPATAPLEVLVVKSVTRPTPN
jgi:uncharacterized protein (TIGR03435 family)